MARPRAPRRGVPGARAGRDRPRGLPRPQPQRAPVARLGAGAARRPERAGRLRRPPGGGLRGPLAAGLRRGLGGPPRALPRPGRRGLERGLERPRRPRPTPRSRASTSAVPSRRSSASRPRSSRSTSSSRSRCGPGADFVIPQLGYDARAWDELLRWMRRADLRMPALANVYVLSRNRRPPLQREPDPRLRGLGRAARGRRARGGRRGQGPGLLPRARRTAGRDRARPRLPRRLPGGPPAGGRRGARARHRGGLRARRLAGVRARDRLRAEGELPVLRRGPGDGSRDRRAGTRPTPGR